ncbi:MAG TPA: ABC transporter substrate-binding protein [bacterium]|nr:ABC transporter substrate-binding protein [bacterium]HPN31421.1 ABC transporter substrate-binding protein [bacterium]
MRFFYCISLIGLIIICGCSKNNQSKENPFSAKKYKIAFAHFGPDIVADNVIKGYIDGLKKSGFIENENLDIIIKHSSGEIANIPLMLQSLESQGLDLIVPMTTPVLTAACGIIKKTKVVFVYTYDPIGAGTGKNFNEHLPNFTGVGSFPPIEDTMKFILELFPSAKKIGVLYNPAEANSVKAIEAAKTYLSDKNIKFEEVSISGTNEIFQGAKSVISREIDVFWGAGDNTVFQAFDGVVKAASESKIPLIINDIEFVEAGALAGVGISWFKSGFEAGLIAARVLKGEPVSKIPIINIAERKIILNNKIAESLNFKFPDKIIKESKK